VRTADCFSIEVLRPVRWTASKVGIVSMQLSPLRVIGMITAAIVTWNVSFAFAIPLTPFRYEARAQRHCPADAVVWLDFRKACTTPKDSDSMPEASMEASCAGTKLAGAAIAARRLGCGHLSHRKRRIYALR
jgi:hypothetical protein